jgi:predicted nuclease of restriction endonuclease-like (RecB) superfamily
MAGKKNKNNNRRALGRARPDAAFPVSPPVSELPADYAGLLADRKRRIAGERLRIVLSANSAMTLLYWDIGRSILERQGREGWGAKVIDRLSSDLRQAFPDMKGLSPRNLKYMRAFAAAWTDREIVQRVVAQLPWRHNIALLVNLFDWGCGKICGKSKKQDPKQFTFESADKTFSDTGMRLKEIDAAHFHCPSCHHILVVAEEEEAGNGE